MRGGNGRVGGEEEKGKGEWLEMMDLRREIKGDKKGRVRGG